MDLETKNHMAVMAAPGKGLGRASAQTIFPTGRFGKPEEIGDLPLPWARRLHHRDFPAGGWRHYPVDFLRLDVLL
jgi:hypothetical protein